MLDDSARVLLKGVFSYKLYNTLLIYNIHSIHYHPTCLQTMISVDGVKERRAAVDQADDLAADG